MAAGEVDAVPAVWRDSSLSTGLHGPEAMASETLARRLHDEQWQVTLACRGRDILALMAIQPNERWLRQLFVRPDAQGAGAGSALLAAAKQATPDGFVLHTDLENHQARAFYERRGLEAGEVSLHPLSGRPRVQYAWAGYFDAG